MPILLTLFLTFAKIGLFTFGGGYAMISIIEDICVEKRKWITHEDMMNVTVIAESTPGPIAINCASFVGYKQGGILGAIAATFGVVLPSFVVIYAISMFLDGFLEIEIIANAFKGIRIAVGLLILRAAVNMFKKMKKTPLSVTVGACSAAVMVLVEWFAVDFSTITLMLLAAVVSLAAFAVGEFGKKKGGDAK
jgi:chromate transporter